MSELTQITVFDRFLNRLGYLIRYSTEELFEFFLATITTFWGACLFFPSKSNFNFSNHIVLSIFARQEYFAWIATILGLCYMFSIFNELTTAKKFTNLLISCGWTFITILYIANNFTSTSVVIYGCFAFFSGLTFLRK